MRIGFDKIKFISVQLADGGSGVEIWGWTEDNINFSLLLTREQTKEFYGEFGEWLNEGHLSSGKP